MRRVPLLAECLPASRCVLCPSPSGVPPQLVAECCVPLLAECLPASRCVLCPPPSGVPTQLASVRRVPQLIGAESPFVAFPRPFPTLLLDLLVPLDLLDLYYICATNHYDSYTICDVPSSL